MTKRNELAGALSGHDAGDARDGEHVALFERRRAYQACRRGVGEADDGARGCAAGSGWFVR